MKKTLLFIAAFLCSYQLSIAQTEKGIQIAGLDLGYGFNNSNSVIINPGNNNSVATLNSKASNFNIGPGYSYFIADNFSIGSAIFWSGSNVTTITPAIATTNYNYATKQTVTNYSGQLFADKYFVHKNKIGFRTGAYIGYGIEKQVTNYSSYYSFDDLNSNSNYYFGGVYLDLVYYPMKKMGMSARLANLSYEHYNNNNTTQGHNSGDELNFSDISDNLSLSIFYVFGGK
jgi:hypothetical protein